MSDHLNAPATKMLAVHCVCCGRALLDAVSVELGIGPECRQYDDAGISEEARCAANKLVFAAALAADSGKISEVQRLAKEIEALGLIGLAEKVGRRFVNARRSVDIEIIEEGDKILVRTPYRRGAAEEFKMAWREIPGRCWNNEKNLNEIPVSSKKHLWCLLKKFFPGKYGMSSKGLFRVPNKGVNNV